jgi:hypothetical protein
MKTFNTSGPNILAEHYTIERLDLLKKGRKLVERNRYFTIWAPRQSGKSTFFRLLSAQLNDIGYKTVFFSVEGMNNYSVGNVLAELNFCIKAQLELDFKLKTFEDLFQKFKSEVINEKWVLIIDEIESLNPELFNQFLHTIRNLYHSRESHALKSVVLVGVSNILGIIQDNASPFNVADNFDVPFFTLEEVDELLTMHETETGQKFEQKVKGKIYEITAGQPGLVNGFAYQLVERNKNKEVIDYGDYLKVENWYLNEAIDKNVAKIVNKAKQYRKFVEEILFSERDIQYTIEKEAIRFLYANGIIKNSERGLVEFWVPLYKKRLYDAFYPDTNGEKDEISENLIIKQYYLADGKLNISFLVQKYKDYILKRSFRPFRDKDEAGKFVSIKEAALIYSFETYIDAFVCASDGKMYREADAGLGKSDLMVNLHGKEYLFETKKYYNQLQFERGKKQLAYYCSRLGIDEGIYLVFLKKSVTYSDEIKEEEIVLDGVTIKVFLVYYDQEKDF